MKDIRKVVIPVAGWGTRSLPATKNIPKEMLPIYNKPVIQYVVEEAQRAHIKDVIFVTNRDKNVIEDHFDHNLQLEDLLERYVASLPAAGRVEKPRDIDYRYAPGRRDIDFTMPMQTPTAICYSFLNGPTEYNIRNYLCSKIAGQILNNRLLKELREEKGWTYSVTGHCGINPDLNGDDGPALLWPVYIKTAPEHAAETRQAVEDAFALLAKEGPTVEEIEKVRSYLLKNHREGLRENGFWLSAMGMHHDYGLDFAADYAPALESITPADIAAFTARAVAANRTRLTLTPQ